MLVLTTDTLPDAYSVKEVFGMVEITYPIEISKKNIFRQLTEGRKNEHEEAYESLVKAAHSATGGAANVIYGVKVSTAVGNFNNGSFLYMTYIGTAARAE
ncbi:hypothetical protein WAQ86_004757 [Salmonella enterica]